MTQQSPLKNATIAAVMTAVIVTPIFGLQLVRQGARTLMEPRWDLVALACALVLRSNCCARGFPSPSRR